MESDYLSEKVVPELFSEKDTISLEKLISKNRQKLLVAEQQKNKIKKKSEREHFFAISFFKQQTEFVETLADDWISANIDLFEYRSDKDKENLADQVLSIPPKIKITIKGMNVGSEMQSSHYHINVMERVPEIYIQGSTLGNMLGHFAHEYCHHKHSIHRFLFFEHATEGLDLECKEQISQIYASFNEGQADKCEEYLWDKTRMKFAFPHSYYNFTKEQLSNSLKIYKSFKENFKISPNEGIEALMDECETLNDPLTTLTTGSVYFNVNDLAPHNYFTTCYDFITDYVEQHTSE